MMWIIVPVLLLSVGHESPRNVFVDDVILCRCAVDTLSQRATVNPQRWVVSTRSEPWR